MGEYYCTGNTVKHLKNHNHQQSVSVHNDLFQFSVIFCFTNTTKHPLFEFLLLWGAYVPPLPGYLDSSTLLLLYKPPNTPTLDPSYTTFITTKLFQKHLQRLNISLIHKNSTCPLTEKLSTSSFSLVKDFKCHLILTVILQSKLFFQMRKQSIKLSC